MTSLLSRVGAFFLDPPRDEPAPDVPATSPDVLTSSPHARSRPRGLAAEQPSRAAAPTPEPPRTAWGDAEEAPGPAASPAFGVVLGAPGAALPVAAACAGELRVRARSAAAVLCAWNGGEPPAGATTPAVRRLAARLEAAGLAATACGRLAWITLDAEPDAAAAEVERACGVALAGFPLVVALVGPRPAAFERFVDAADHAIAVLPPEADAALRTLARSTLPPRAARILPPLPPGPPRWAAMAGLARLRALRAERP